jgi:hypothetical protein
MTNAKLPSRPQVARFWNWVQKNEPQIVNAFLLGIQTDAVYFQLRKRLGVVSKRIDFIIAFPPKSPGSLRFVFTCFGRASLFDKIIALEQQAPPLRHIGAQAFIQPLTDISEFLNGTDLPVICPNFEIKISSLVLSLENYNIASQQLKIKVYLTHYDVLRHFEDLKTEIEWIVLLLVGEIAYCRHIKAIELSQLPLGPNSFLPLVELVDLIESVSGMDSRRKMGSV